MARYREYNTNQNFSITVDSEEIKKHNPLVRAIDGFVEEHVSLEPFSKKVHNDSGGAPAVHPRMMLKILFYSYAIGVYLSREMEERLRWDQNYICLSGNQKVDHSTICNFILKYKEEIMEIFSILVRLMESMGYAAMGLVAVDGTKMMADVGKEYTGTVEYFKKKKARIEKKIEQIIEQTLNEELSESQRARYSAILKRLEGIKVKLEAFLSWGEKEKNSKSKVSLTDIDAVEVIIDGKSYMGYNCLIAVDKKNHIIVAVMLVASATDTNCAVPMTEMIMIQSGNDLESIELVFDPGFFSQSNMEYFYMNDINVIMPEGRGKSGMKRRNTGRVNVRDCEMNMEDGRLVSLTCPGNQVMEPREYHSKTKGDIYKFYPKKQVCKESCPLMGKCYASEKSSKTFWLVKGRVELYDFIEEQKETLSSPEGKQRMRDRASIVEHVFGEIKELYRFRKFRHRGTGKVELIWCMVCTGYNFRKLARLKYRTGGDAI
jgi:transposase